MLDIKTLENWLWDACCKIRGSVDAPKYKDFILPLDESVVLLKEAEEESVKTDEKLKMVLQELGFE